jgi:hypothetical protein
MAEKKPLVYIFIKPHAQSTKILTRYVAKNLDLINQYVIVKFIRVEKATLDLVKRQGIKHTPTLIHNKKKYVTLEKIIKILTPPNQRKDNFGYGRTSSDEFLHDMQMAVLDDESDGDADEFDTDRRGEELRQKMTAFQTRRPEMKGVSKKQKLRGGRKVHASNPKKTDFRNDNEFRNLTGIDNIDSTPTSMGFTELDGETLLENYRNEIADAEGRKPSTKRRRPIPTY